MGIHTKLVLCLLAVLIPLGAVSTFAMNLFDQQLTKRTELALSNKQHLEAARINEILAGYAQDARGLAAGTHVKQFVEGVNAYREAKTSGIYLSEIKQHIIGGHDGFAIVRPDSAWPLQQLALSLQGKAGVIGSAVVELRLVDRQAKTLGESVGFSWEPADAAIIERAMLSVKTVFGDAFRNDLDQQHLGMVSPVISDSGEVVGALMLETRLHPITDLVAKHEWIGNSSEAHIAQPTLNGHAQFITKLRFDKKAAFNKIVPRTKNLPINQALNSYGGRIIYAKDYRGVDSILSIETIPATGWGLVVKIDVAEAYEPVTRLRKALSIAVLISLIVILAGYIFCLVPIAQRLKKTAAAAHKIMNGDLTTRVYDPINDEIGHMARTIDTLARDLEADQRRRSEVEARLRHQASHDDLTNLFNRKHANAVINQLNDDKNNSHSVMFLDLNGFKDVNDLFDHATGDEVLVTVAQRLSEAVPEKATLARWGGDEFVVILPEVGDKEATQFALSLHNVFDDSIVTSQGVHNITCSIGLATSSDMKSLDDALMEADILMYEQKKRQQLDRSAIGMTARTVDRALNENRVEVWFQPIVRFEQQGSYVLSAAEALVRLRTREGGVILPDDFLPQLTNSALGLSLDRRIISLCLQSLSRWHTAGIVTNDFKLSLNISAQSLNDPKFSAYLGHQLQSASIRPDQIILEVPEETDMDQSSLSQLRQLGVSISLNRINTDPPSLGQLAQMQPDVAKIDHHWLKSEVVAKHLIAICHELQMEIIVEGVTSKNELQRLHALGVSQYQGPLIDQPLRAVDFISRWGRSSLHGLGQHTNRSLALRLAS